MHADPLTPENTEPLTPPPRRHRRALILTYAALAAAAGITAFILASPGSHQAVTPLPAVSFTPSVTAAVPVTTMSTWCAGAGNAMLRHVRADLDRVGADARAGDLAATEADGGRLTADAEAAEQLPPPVTRAQQLSYVEAMGALSFAGTDLSAGNLAAANRAISAASGYLSQDKGILTC